MMTSFALQWMLLGGYLALMGWTVAAARRHARLRATAFGVWFLSATHVIYYALFLIWPDILDGYETMMFSIVLRFQVLFLAGLILALAVRRDG